MHIDPFLFTEDAVPADVKAFVADLERAIALGPDTTGWSAEQLREQRKSGAGVFGKRPFSRRARNRRIDGPAGEIKLRVIEPDADPRGIYIHIHGGGWVLGDVTDQDDRLERYVDDHGLVTISIEYRLAPEDPYPAAPDDCEAAARWIIERATEEFGTDVVLIGGESAGAHLSVVTLLRLRDRHDYTSCRGANLLYGAYDLALTPSARNWGPRDLILSTPSLEFYNGEFLAGADARDPDVSPLYADLDGLPAALFTIGTYDPIMDDSLFMAMRWAEFGLRSEVAIYPGGVHAFDYFETAQAQQSHDRIAEFIESVL